MLIYIEITKSANEQECQTVHSESLITYHSGNIPGGIYYSIYCGDVALLRPTIVAVARKLVFISIEDCVIWLFLKG